MSEKRFFFLRGRGSVWLPRGAGVSVKSSSSFFFAEGVAGGAAAGVVLSVAGVAEDGVAGVFFPVSPLRSFRPCIAKLDENLNPNPPSPSGTLNGVPDAPFFIGVMGSILAAPPLFAVAGVFTFDMLGVGFTFFSSSESRDGYGWSSGPEGGDKGVVLLKESRAESRCWGEWLSGVVWRSMIELSLVDCSVIRESVGYKGKGVSLSVGGKDEQSMVMMMMMMI